MNNRPRYVMNPVQNKGYSHAGASYTKKALKGFVVESGSPAEDINANNYTLRQRSRMMYMGAPIATAALKRQRTNIVGSGLRLKPTIDREVLHMTQEQAEVWQRRTHDIDVDPNNDNPSLVSFRTNGRRPKGLKSTYVRDLFSHNILRFLVATLCRNDKFTV